MASYTVALSKHQTLGAGTADTITFSQEFKFTAVKNRASSGAGISFRVDGTAAVALADNTYIVMPGEEVVVVSSGSDTVSLISATADAYSVTGVPE